MFKVTGKSWTRAVMRIIQAASASGVNDRQCRRARNYIIYLESLYEKNQKSLDGGEKRMCPSILTSSVTLDRFLQILGWKAEIAPSLQSWSEEPKK